MPDIQYCWLFLSCRCPHSILAESPTSNFSLHQLTSLVFHASRSFLPSLLSVWWFGFLSAGFMFLHFLYIPPPTVRFMHVSLYYCLFLWPTCKKLIPYLCSGLCVWIVNMFLVLTYMHTFQVHFSGILNHNIDSYFTNDNNYFCLGWSMSQCNALIVSVCVCFYFFIALVLGSEPETFWGKVGMANT